MVRVTVAEAAAMTKDNPKWTSDYPAPAVRRFRVYALDPLASAAAETSGINEMIITLPWENPWEEPLGVGPSGEYLEVIDYDPALGLFYKPLDPNDVLLVAQDGLPPSEGVPQFHQQMVYAVAMRTIRNFERALGRKVLWARDREESADDGFIQKLRLYPHALREANAYYSPQKKALLFGYFRATPVRTGRSLPNAWIFTCLSHDIIAHETTHAILDGVHTRFIDPSSLDSLAFHEAFADTVALLQHFTMPEVVAHQLGQTRGRLSVRTLLSGLAAQFGDATGRPGALREAIDGAGDVTSSVLSNEIKEPHERGAVLVAAIFDALVTIFERRSTDLIRLATGYSEPQGQELSPDLVKRLAAEAAKSADHLLRICVRALDYVPPFDISFGDYLRAMITADADLVVNDRFRYRQAIAEAFRRRGIYPKDVMSMVPDSLLWQGPALWDAELAQVDFNDLVPKLDRTPRMTRLDIWNQARSNRLLVHKWLQEPDPFDSRWERLLGLKLTEGAPKTITRSERTGLPSVEVHSVRLADRQGPDGETQQDWVIEITQRRRGYYDPAIQKLADAKDAPQRQDKDAPTGEAPRDAEMVPTEPDFWFRGGATLLVDQITGKVRYGIRKRIDDEERLKSQRAYLTGASEGSAAAVYFGKRVAEPFALLHRS